MNDISMHTSDRKVIQFQLWEECNSGCPYCYEGPANRKTPIKQKIDVLNSVIDTLQSDKIKQYNVVSFIGGEIFQGQLNDDTVRRLFFKAIDLVVDLYKQQMIKSVQMCTSMMIGNCEDLYTTLDKLTDCDDVWVATSYDTLNRFKTPKMLQTWQHHMITIYQRYKNVSLNTTMILTQDLIEKYINDEFSFKQFAQLYHTSIYVKPPTPFKWVVDSHIPGVYDVSIASRQLSESILPKFFPKRDTMLEFLVKFRQNESTFEYDKLFNVNMRADTYLQTRQQDDYKTFNIKREKTGTKLAESNSGTNQCGHSLYYSIYLDSDKCMLCDKLNIRNLFK